MNGAAQMSTRAIVAPFVWRSSACFEIFLRKNAGAALVRGMEARVAALADLEDLPI